MLFELLLCPFKVIGKKCSDWLSFTKCQNELCLIPPSLAFRICFTPHRRFQPSPLHGRPLNAFFGRLLAGELSHVLQQQQQCPFAAVVVLGCLTSTVRVSLY